MSGLAGSSNPLVDLLRVVANPDLHAARLKELTDKEAIITAVQTAIDAKAATVATDKKALTAERKKHLSDVDTFSAERDNILAKAALFDERETAVGKREDAVSDIASMQEAAGAKLKAEIAVMQASLSDRESKIAKAEQRHIAERAEIDSLQKQLAEKMTVIKSLAS